MDLTEAMTNSLLTHDPVFRIAHDLGIWLQAPDWTMADLINWLEGNSLPPVGYDDEPFIWLLRGIMVTDSRYEVERELSTRLRLLLSEQPDVNQFGDRPSQVIYNLLMMCAGLSFAEVFADELYEIFERRQLDGNWLGVDLRMALRDALVSNQRDDRMKFIWTGMLEGRRHDFLPGNEYDGFLGVLHLPDPARPRGEPFISEIGRALSQMARFLGDRPDRRSEFYDLVARVHEMYLGRPSLASELIFEAETNSWPDWALVSLPSLCVPLMEHKEERFYLLWDVFVALLATFKVEFSVKRELCHGRIFLVKLQQKHSNLLDEFAPLIERRRLEMPLASYSAVLGGISDILSEVQVVLEERDRKAARAYAATRAEIKPVIEWLPRSDNAGSFIAQARIDVLKRNYVGASVASVR